MTVIFREQAGARPENNGHRSEDVTTASTKENKTMIQLQAAGLE